MNPNSSNETRAAVLNEALEKLRKKKARIEQTYHVGNAVGVGIAIEVLESMLADREKGE